MGFTGSGLNMSVMYRPEIPGNPVIEEGISNSHANAMGMSLRLLLIF